MKRIMLFMTTSVLFFISCGSDNSQPSSTQPPVSMIKDDISNTAEGKALSTLLERSDCKACHQLDSKSIGPSYVDIASKYGNDSSNVAFLSEKIIKGGVGVWGQVPMTPHPNISKEDADDLVKAILQLKK